MRRLIALALLLLSPLTALAGPADAIVRIPSHGGSGSVIATGDGWSLILSAAHMFQGADAKKPIKIDAPAPVQGASPKAVGIVLLGTDPAMDLALIRLNAGPLPFVAPVAPVGHRVVNTCLSVGYDNMKMPSTQKPAHVAREGEQRTYTVEKPWHGRSGGALLDGPYLVGVVGGYTPNEGFYASHRAVIVFLGRFPGAAGPAPVVPIQVVPQVVPQYVPQYAPQYAPQFYQAPFASPCPGGVCPPGVRR